MTYAFGLFEFDSRLLELRKAGRLVPLEPQPARALSLLLERAGETVSREDLAAHIWGSGTHVDYNRGLAYCVGQIRAAVGDEGDNPRFVQTLPRRGFKFVAPVSTSQRSEPAPSAASIVPGGCVQQPSGAVNVRPRAIAIGVAFAIILLVAILAATFGARAFRQWRRPIVAVSIFDNETGDRRYDLAVHRLSDSVVNQLTGLGSDRIGVVGNAAVLRIPRNDRDLELIASQTGASHVVLAQLQPLKGDLSLLMHLIRLDDGTHLWTRRIARPNSGSLDGLDEEAARTIESGILEHVLRANP